MRGWLADERYHVAHYFAQPSGDLDALLLPGAGRRRGACWSPRTPRATTTIRTPSLTAHCTPQMHPFRRESPNIRHPLRGQPWQAAARFPFDRYDRRSSIDNYPFIRGRRIAPRSQRGSDPRGNHRTGGLPLHLQRRAGLHLEIAWAASTGAWRRHASQHAACGRCAGGSRGREQRRDPALRRKTSKRQVATSWHWKPNAWRCRCRHEGHFVMNTATSVGQVTARRCAR